MISAFFVLLLSLTGLVLQHDAWFKLDSRFIRSSRILAWYNIEVPDVTTSYSDAQHSISLIANKLYFDALPLDGVYRSLTGFIAQDFGYVVSTIDQLLLLTELGETVEILGSVHGLPSPIDGMGLTSDDELVLSVAGAAFRANLDSLIWSSVVLSNEEMALSTALPLSQELTQLIKQDYGNSLLSWERLVLDLHSGRFLGAWGERLMDVMALLFIFMALTGLWIWSRRRS